MNDAARGVQVVQTQQSLPGNLLDKANGYFSAIEAAAELISSLSHHVENHALMFTINSDVRKVIK